MANFCRCDEDLLISSSFDSENVILYIPIKFTKKEIKLSMLNKKRQEVIKGAAVSHRESMRRSLHNRLEAARANANSKLIKQLEAEAKYLHL